MARKTGAAAPGARPAPKTHSPENDFGADAGPALWEWGNGESLVEQRPSEGPELPLEDVLVKLKSQGGIIDKLDDEISVVLRNVEEILIDVVSTRIAVELPENDEGGYREWLAYGKHNGRWGLLLVKYFEESESGSEDMLLNSPRERRVEMLSNGYLERLIRDANNQLDAQIELRKRAIATGRAIQAALNRTGGAG